MPLLFTQSPGEPGPPGTNYPNWCLALQKRLSSPELVTSLPLPPRRVGTGMLSGDGSAGDIVLDKGPATLGLLAALPERGWSRDTRVVWATGKCQPCAASWAQVSGGWETPWMGQRYTYTNQND